MPAARGWAEGFLARSESYRALFGDDLDAAARKIGIAAGSLVLVGTPAEVAEQLIKLHRATGLRGYMFIRLLCNPPEVARPGQVLPHLDKEGLWEEPPSTREWSW